MFRQYKKMFLLFLLLSGLGTTPVYAMEKLENLEVNCWSKAIDDDGSFLCSYVIAMGDMQSQDRKLVPEVFAPDNGGPKTEEQAWRVCRAMGFSYAKKFSLEYTKKDAFLLMIQESLREGDLIHSSGSFLQHVNCL